MKFLLRKFICRFLLKFSRFFFMSVSVAWQSKSQVNCLKSTSFINKWLMGINLPLSFFSVFIGADHPTLTLAEKSGRSGDANQTNLWASPYSKNCTWKFMQANWQHHKLLDFHLFFWIWEVWKGREKMRIKRAFQVWRGIPGDGARAPARA